MSAQLNRDAENTRILEFIQRLVEHPIDMKLQLLQHHAQMARLLAGEILERDRQARRRAQ